MPGTHAAVLDTADDLTECDREPIHIPETIQPHGILFGLSPDDLRVTAVSQNLGTYCAADPASLLGTPLASLIDHSSFEQVVGARLDPGQSLRLVGLRLAGSPPLIWRGILHAQEGRLLLEAEPRRAGAELDALDHFDRFHNAILRLQTARDVQSTCNSLVREVRSLTGFSRVMLYRFATDWSGEVIAEESDGQMPSYTGLHFPAGDIPVQARALYTRNASRQIPDIAYRPVRVLHAGPGPLDLSPVALRSVSPLHIAYLRNMGVGAAMSVSLLRDGRLWGLIACHHPCAHAAPPEKLKSCVLLAQVAMARFVLINEAEMARRDVAVQAVESRLLQQAAQREDSGSELLQAGLMTESGDALLDLLDASGVAISAGGATIAIGEAPSGDALQGLLRWLQAEQHDLLATDHLSAVYPAAASLAGAAGMLAVPLGTAAGDAIVWFRPEIARSVTWAGEPLKQADRMSGHDILTPRHSFAAWTEQVRGRSRAWSAGDIAVANSLHDTLIEILAHRAAHVQRKNEQLLRSNEELESFAYVASHDLKEPLRQIEMYGTLLQRAFGRLGIAEEKVERWFAGIAGSARRLRTLIDHLAQYSQLGSEQRPYAPTDFRVLLAEVIQDFSSQISASGSRIEAGLLPVITCDAIQMRQVLQNLIGNAIKYRHPDRQLLITISATRHDEPGPGGDWPVVVFTVQDNGIGFDDRYREQIFKPFERLHSAESYDGSGLGLAICRKVIERHGGRITAAGRCGLGSTFTITLPDHRPSDREGRAA